MNIAGDWIGEIIMGKEYGQHEGRKPVFKMSLEQNGESITGSAQDLDGFGVNPEPASVVGDIRGQTFSFTKRYPTMHTVVENEIVIDENFPGSEILYVGTFDDVEQLFIGNWTMIMKVWIWRIIPWTFKSRGTWNMKREPSMDNST